MFFKYIKCSLCSTQESSRKVQYIICQQKVIDELTDDLIYFFIDDWNIKFKIKELFLGNVFQIMSVTWRKNWTLGNILIDNHLITVDKNNGIIYYN